MELSTSKLAGSVLTVGTTSERSKRAGKGRPAEQTLYLQPGDKTLGIDWEGGGDGKGGIVCFFVLQLRDLGREPAAPLLSLRRGVCAFTSVIASLHVLLRLI